MLGEERAQRLRKQCRINQLEGPPSPKTWVFGLSEVPDLNAKYAPVRGTATGLRIAILEKSRDPALPVSGPVRDLKLIR